MTGKTCDRFEREGLLKLEAGGAPDPHFDTCPACQKARAEYERLSADLADLGTGDEPPPYWQARTWARIESRRAARRKRRQWLWWLGPAVAAAAAMALFTLRPAPPPPLDGLEVTVERGEATLRGLEARPGDRLTLRTPVGAAAHAELRVYRDDAELVLRCSTEEPCRRRGDELRATLTLDAAGSYQPLLLLAGEPLPPPSGGGLDADARAALEAGAHVDLGDEIHVR